jgi:hypothetical protein
MIFGGYPMKRFLFPVFTVGLALAAAPVRADDQAEIKALLDKAIKASGGEEKLAKAKGTVSKIKGKWYGMGEGIPYTGEISIQPNQKRFEVNAEAGDMKFKFVQVIDGDKGWKQLNNDTTDMEKEAIAEVKEELNLYQAKSLVALQDKEYTLSPLGETKVDKKKVTGLKVSRKGFRDVNLFFDKETGLLIKTETTIKDIDMGGKEFTEESIFSDFKEIEGKKVPTKVVVNRDGKLYLEGESTEIKFHEKIDDGVFAKP